MGFLEILGNIHIGISPLVSCLGLDNNFLGANDVIDEVIDRKG